MKFNGTENPRHLRALNALLKSPIPREILDKKAGCSNGPELVAQLRRLGLELPCERVPVIDRDGQTVYRGVYHLTPGDRRAVIRWLAEREAGNEA